MTNTSKTKLFASATELAAFAAKCRKEEIITIKAIKIALKTFGKFTTEKNVDAVLDEVRKQKKVAEKRKASRYAQLRLEPEDLALRLEKKKKALVEKYFTDTYRVCTHGSVYVKLTDDPAKIRVYQRDYKDYDIYRGSFKGWGALVKDTTIAVPRLWGTRVERRGLAVVDGMMTLDASRMQADGCELFSASWIKQGRGNNVELVSGYIARSGAYSFHASTPDQAIKGLKRKINAMSLEIALDNGDDLSRLSSGFESAIVRISDAQAIGACDFGIKNWCARAGLDYAAGSASLRDVVAAYRAHPWIEARATILRVLRRLRADRQPIAA